MGRSKRRGERFPGGKLRPGQGGDPVAVWQRARLEWVRAGRDPQGATQLGRLGIIGELNESEVAAGFKIAEVYGRYESSIGRRRTAASPSYEVGRGREQVSETDAERDRARTVRRAFDALSGELAGAERQCGRGLKDAVEAVCVEDRVCPAGRLGDVRLALDLIAAHFRLDRRRERQRGTNGINRQAPHVPLAHPGGREAFIETLCSIVPDMDADAAEEAFDALIERERFDKALMDREKFRMGKETK
jgi:hypothetical protein